LFFACATAPVESPASPSRDTDGDESTDGSPAADSDDSKDRDDSDDSVVVDPPEDTPPEPVDCTAPCAALDTPVDEARCYACQCKNAMDGWLPGPDELQCSRGDPIEVYTTDNAGLLTLVEADVAACANPTLLYGTCAPGGTLGQLTHGDVSVKWICRRNAFRRDYADPNAPYDDVGAIFYNARTGATCWFDDTDGTGIAGDNWPILDLTRTDADPDAWTSFFYHSEGQGCVGCHDNDPFLYTPFLRAIDWQDGPWTSGSFRLVTKAGALEPTGARHLVSPEAAPCTTCHRITSTQTCAGWARDSVGAAKGYGHQDTVVDAAGDLTDPLWSLGTWMPPGVLEPAAWQATYGDAARLIQRCCAQPGVDRPAQGEAPACRWEDMP
jgi:hypothetical protein